MNKNTLVINALEEIICNPEHDDSKLRQYFSSDYQQTINGHHLDYNGFVEHMALLKNETRHMKLSVIASAANGDTVFSHHEVAVEKKQGGYASFEVFAHFTVTGDKIVKCRELTRMISGNDNDSDLGSRR
ncbi:nuclear transport factor 2 family protein [Vibrio salinus]|uniref:nuclear transport factor 2 family protein n=1 Tax=Vibrio salinus TaxID=2899784 RepID=UPI001E5670C5|nr:nuclear transport factor 2 family protein [Vibrio salinus]MCE0495063.1 nuclear transport factor 2 family protein [Vibrio salinus]